MTRFILLNWLDLTVAQFSSVAQSCLTLWNLMDGSTPGLPPHPSPTTGVYSNSCPSSRSCHATISSSIVTFSSCLQSFPASVSFPLSLFSLFGHQVAKVLEFQLQHQSFRWIFRTDFLQDLLSLQSKGLSRVFSNIEVQTHQFFGAPLSL